MVQPGSQASSGSFRLSDPRAERSLTNEARQDMPGVAQPISKYKAQLHQVGANSGTGGDGEGYVCKGADVDRPVPQISAGQLAYLKKKLP